mgnify:FL=1|jgi:hypothetical protein
MKPSGTSISLMIDYFDYLYSIRNEWLTNVTTRDAVMLDMANFDATIYNEYWLTDREEQLLDTLATLIEVYI